MKKRSKTYSTLMLVPPMVLMALIWSPSSNAIDIKSFLPETLTARTLAVIKGEQDTSVAQPEHIKFEDILDEDQPTIEEATQEVVENTEGALPKKVEEEKEVVVAEVKVETTEDDEVGEVSAQEESVDKSKEEEEEIDQVACNVEKKKKTLTQEVESQEQDIMAQFNDFFQAVMVPMMANYISSQSFKAPPVQTGFTGIPAQNTNFGAGLGLNLMSLSDYFNARSMGFGASTINNYNVTGDFYNGAYNNTMGSTPMGLNSNGMNGMNQFNAGMSQTMFNSATASPHTFNFGMAVQDHSRFDQMRPQNTQASVAPLVQSAPVAPIVNGPAPAATTTNQSAARNTVAE